MIKFVGDDCNICICRLNGWFECIEKICCKYCFYIKVFYFLCMSILYEYERYYEKILYFFKIIFVCYFNFCLKFLLVSLIKIEFEELNFLFI